MINRQRIPALDLIRLLAAMAVVFFHYFFLGGVNGENVDVYLPSIGGFAKYGYLGVDVFFVISGLVIAWSAEGSRAGAFAWKRFLRVYPTFIFCAFLTAFVIAIASDPRFNVSLKQTFAHLFMDSRRLGQPLLDGSYWTIVFEVIFYTMVTVGLAVPILRRNADTLLWLWLGVSIFNEAFLHTKFLSYFAISDFAGLFVAGIAMYRLHRGRTSVGNFMLLTVALIYAAERAVVTANTRFTAVNVPWSPYVVLCTLGFSLLLLYLSLSYRTTPRTAKLLKQCGALTYPLYLLHGTVGFILINMMARRFKAEASLFASLGLMLMLACAVAFWVEPVLKGAFESVRRIFIERFMLRERTHRN